MSDETAPDDHRAVRTDAPGYLALVLLAASALVLVAGVVYAFAFAGARNAPATDRFRLLAQAGSPFVAALALASVLLVARERTQHDDRAGTPLQVGGGAAFGAGSAIALVTVLLALSGVVIDLTQSTSGGAMFRLSSVLGRLGTIALAGYTLWLAATAPVRRESPRAAARQRSPRDAPDPSSPM